MNKILLAVSMALCLFQGIRASDVDMLTCGGSVSITDTQTQIMNVRNLLADVIGEMSGILISLEVRLEKWLGFYVQLDKQVQAAIKTVKLIQSVNGEHEECYLAWVQAVLAVIVGTDPQVDDCTRAFINAIVLLLCQLDELLMRLNTVVIGVMINLTNCASDPNAGCNNCTSNVYANFNINTKDIKDNATSIMLNIIQLCVCTNVLACLDTVNNATGTEISNSTRTYSMCSTSCNCPNGTSP